jgi:ketosteroid isomerase-like protein
MGSTRRSVIAAASVGLASLEMARAAGTGALAGPGSIAENEVAELVRRSEKANSALMRGDVDGYRALTPIAHDFTLMSPFGGKPSRGSEITNERWDAMRQFFRNGTLTVELVQAYRSEEMVVLALIERTNVEVGGLPAQDWSLRVTLVYRREGADWRLAHRHADPLGKGISVQSAAAIARGEYS